MVLALDAGTLDRIQKRQAEIRPIRALLMMVAGLLYGIGWLLFQVWALVWSVFSWSLAAGAEGWCSARDAHKASRGQSP